MKKQTWLVLLLVLAMVMTAGLLQACTKTYTITFMADGVVVETLTVNQGAAVTFPAVPAKDGYTGVWNPTSIASATADATVNAVYTSTAATYDVTFVADGTTVTTLAIEEGAGVNASQFPAVPAKAGYVGVWEVTSISAVSANMTVNAVYTKIHTITFVVDEAVIDTIEVLDGEAVPAFPAVPAKEGYTGVWNPTAIDEITGDVTVTAVYTAINYVTLAFDTDGGDEMEAVQLEAGVVPTMPATPVKDGYTFTGWYADAAMNDLYDFTAAVTADTTVYAAWTINEYTVTVPTEYQNTINYVEFVTLYYVDGVNVEIESGDSVPYGTEVFFEYNTLDLTKVAVVYANGELVLGGSIVVTENVNLTAKAAYVVNFDADGGDFDVTFAVVNEQGSIEMPTEIPTKTGYHFVGWYVGEDEFVNNEISEIITTVAAYEKNVYTVSASTELANVTLELGATSAQYEDTVGLRVIDNRTVGSVPLLIRVNGEVIGNGETDGVMDGATDKVFTIEITENTVITVTAEYRYQTITFNYGTVSGLNFYKETVAAAFFAAHIGGVTTEEDGRVLANYSLATEYYAAGNTISFYIEVAEGFDVALNTANPDVAAYWSMVPASAGASIAGVNNEDHYFPALAADDDMTNKYLVTVTLPAPVANNATYNVYLASSFSVTANTYTINGMNVANDNYIMKQASIIATGSGNTVSFGITPTTEFTTYTSTAMDAMYKSNIVFVKLNEDKNYYVTMNGYKVFDTLNDDTDATWTDAEGNVYDVFVIEAVDTEVIDLAGALCDQNWEVVEYKTVTVKLNGNDYATPMGAGDVRQIEVGQIWEATISNAFQVKINGVVQTGTVGATTTTYRYQVKQDITVELTQKYNVVLERPSGTEDATVTNMTTSCLYGDTVTATITPAGTYDKIMVVKAVDETSTYMLSGLNNVYTYEAGIDNGVVHTSHLTEDIEVLTVKYEFTNQYVLVEYNEDTTAYAPVECLLGETVDDAWTWYTTLTQSYLSNPSMTGYIFRGWEVQEWNGTEYVTVDVEVDPTLDDVMTLPELMTANYAFTVLDETNTHPDKLVAVYDRITPNVIIDDQVTDPNRYDLDTVKVDGSTIYLEGAEWVTYAYTMTHGGYVMDYADTFTFTLDVTTTLITEGFTLQVYVNTVDADNEIFANANGEYIVNLADYDYAAFNEDFTILITYAAPLVD